MILSWVLDHWLAVIMLPGSFVLLAVLAVVAQWWDKQDVEAQESNYGAGARRRETMATARPACPAASRTAR